jgi:hypothetical protein
MQLKAVTTMTAVAPTFIELVQNSKQHSDWEDANSTVGKERKKKSRPIL